MALLFRRGGPQVGAMRAPARTAGLTALVAPGAIPAAGITIFLDQAQCCERIATVAIAGAISSDHGGFRA
jgi:hypothetical protein